MSLSARLENGPRLAYDARCYRAQDSLTFLHLLDRMWECLALVDDATVDLLKGLGGVAAIAISHPHYYTTMVEWSRAFGNA